MNPKIYFLFPIIILFGLIYVFWIHQLVAQKEHITKQLSTLANSKFIRVLFVRFLKEEDILKSFQIVFHTIHPTQSFYRYLTYMEYDEYFSSLLTFLDFDNEEDEDMINLLTMWNHKWQKIIKKHLDFLNTLDAQLFTINKLLKFTRFTS